MTATSNREEPEVNIEVLARQRLALLEEREAIDEKLAAIDADIIDAVEVGGAVDLDGQVVFRVQTKRTFSTVRAKELVSEEVLAAATVPTLDTKLLRQLLPPALTDACMVEGRPFVAKARS